MKIEEKQEKRDLNQKEEQDQKKNAVPLFIQQTLRVYLASLIQKCFHESGDMEGKRLKLAMRLFFKAGSDL